MYIPLHCQHQKDFHIKMGSDVTERIYCFINCATQSHQCPKTIIFEAKGEPKRTVGHWSFHLSAEHLDKAKPIHLSCW